MINLGIVFGAGVYEHRIVVPRWTPTEERVRRWDAEAARRDDTGRRFWGLASTAPLTLLAVANAAAAYHAAGAVRVWWLAAASIALAERALTFGYFIPTMVRLMHAPASASALASAGRWQRMNYVRHALVLAAWLAAQWTLVISH